MPIVIDEVVITVEVGNPTGAAAALPATAAASVQDKQALVAECVERVLEVLAERKEP